MVFFQAAASPQHAPPEPPLEPEELLAAFVLLAITVGAGCRLCCFVLRPTRGSKSTAREAAWTTMMTAATTAVCHAPTESMTTIRPEQKHDVIEDDLAVALKREATLSAALGRVRHRTAKLKKKLGVQEIDIDGTDWMPLKNPAPIDALKTITPAANADKAKKAGGEALEPTGEEKAIKAVLAAGSSMASTAAALQQLAVRSAAEAAEAQAAAATALAEAAAAREAAVRAALEAAARSQAEGKAHSSRPSPAAERIQPSRGWADDAPTSSSAYASEGEAEAHHCEEAVEDEERPREELGGPWIPLSEFVPQPVAST